VKGRQPPDKTKQKQPLFSKYFFTQVLKSRYLELSALWLWLGNGWKSATLF
jgi:hypothetical protein